MAVTVASLQSGKVDATTDPVVTPSFTPTANRLVLAAIGSYDRAAAPTLTGNSLTWVLVLSTVNSSYRVSVYRAMSATPTAGALTIDYSDPGDFTTWSIVEFDGVSLAGTDGSDAVVQAVGATGTSTTALATLAAFGSAGNATYGASQWGGGPVTPGSGFTELHEERAYTTYSLETEWKNSDDTTVDATAATSLAWAIIGVEIKEAVPASAGNNRRLMLGVG